ncbi:unnamed protein product [Trichobilharzia regenti]|nr:unnamed protein product [Trichobilharzia regenti]
MEEDRHKNEVIDANTLTTSTAADNLPVGLSRIRDR